MCVASRTFQVERGEGYQEVTTACGECWQCRLMRVNDFVGRGLCETAYSDHTCAITLTYADGHEGDPHKYLHKEHFQKFIRALRIRDHRLRYICVSELGELKGRLHFHALLFFTGKRPDWPQGVRYNIPHDRDARGEWSSIWPWGHVFVDWNAGDRALRYCLKYVLKNADRKSYWKSSSLKPALGHQFFMDKADQAISHGVMPSSFLYAPPGAREGIRYRMSGATRRNYINRIAEGLRDAGRCPLSITNEIVNAAVEHADRWAIDRDERAKIALMSDDEREAYCGEIFARYKRDIGQRAMSDAQAERYLNKLAIQNMVGAVEDIDQIALDMRKAGVPWWDSKSNTYY